MIAYCFNTNNSNAVHAEDNPIQMKKIGILFVLIFSFESVLFAQNQSDIALLRYTDFEDPRFRARHVTYGFSENPSWFTRFNPVYHVFSGSMFVYQKFVSVQLPTSCSFRPSCSEFSRQLIRRFGLVRGIFFSADRLMRCNRIALTGVPASLFNPVDGKIHECTDRYCFGRR